MIDVSKKLGNDILKEDLILRINELSYDYRAEKYHITHHNISEDALDRNWENYLLR